MSSSDKKEWDWEIPLLEALRGYGAGDVKELPARVTAELIAHAADEIERLRKTILGDMAAKAAMRMMEEHHHEILRLRAENERLREENAILKDLCKGKWEQIKDAIRESGDE